MSKYIPVNKIEGEKWYPIPSLEGIYKVSNLLRFKSVGRQIGLMPNGSPRIWRERLCTGGLDKNGYVVLNFRDANGKKVMKKAHRIIGEIFIPNPENKKQINHKTGIKADNNLDQLEWATNSENQIHARKLGLNKQIGQTCNTAKLTNEQVICIFKSNENQFRLADRFGVCQPTISSIKTRKTWRSVTNGV